MAFAPWSCSQMWFSVNAIDSKVSSRFDGLSSHSHTVIQCHPIAANCFCSSLSLSLFLRIFATQKSRFVFGILQQFEFSSFAISTRCPCQKHPFTKMQVRYLRNTKSGCPGNLLWFSLYLNPLFHSPRRTIISGFVSFDRIAAMLACRCCVESLSISHLNDTDFQPQFHHDIDNAEHLVLILCLVRNC